MVFNSKHTTEVAYPFESKDGVSGWYTFNDSYLSPQIVYGSIPPVTTIRIGGRFLEVDRAVPCKMRLLEPDEDYDNWTCKKQHLERVNLGEFHRDFGDVEIAYSFSSPQTHIWFCGYMIHFDCLENVSISSYNATVNIRGEHILPAELMPEVAERKSQKRCLKDLPESGGRTAGGCQSNRDRQFHPMYTANCEQQTRTFRSSVDDQKEVLPFYCADIPFVVESIAGRRRVEYASTPQHLNDCERDIRKIENFDATSALSQYATPSSYPPVYPKCEPHELPSYIKAAPDQLPFKRYHVPGVVVPAKNRQKMLTDVHKLSIKDVRSQKKANGKFSGPETSRRPKPFPPIRGLNFDAVEPFKQDAPGSLSNISILSLSEGKWKQVENTYNRPHKGNTETKTYLPI